MTDILVKIKSGLNKVFNNIKSFGERAFAPQLEFTEPQKICGNDGEDKFYREISSILPSDTKILKNINIIDNDIVIGEVDFLIIYITIKFLLLK